MPNPGNDDNHKACPYPCGNKVSTILKQSDDCILAWKGWNTCFSQYWISKGEEACCHNSSTKLRVFKVLLHGKCIFISNKWFKICLSRLLPGSWSHTSQVASSYPIRLPLEVAIEECVGEIVGVWSCNCCRREPKRNRTVSVISVFWIICSCPWG